MFFKGTKPSGASGTAPPGTEYNPFWDAGKTYAQGAPVSHRNAPWFRGVDWELGDEPGKGDNNGWFTVDSQPIGGSWNGYFRESQSSLPGADGFPATTPTTFDAGEEFTKGWTSRVNGNQISISDASGLIFTGSIETLIPLDPASTLSANEIYLYIQTDTGEDFWLTNQDTVSINVAVIPGFVRVRLFQTVFSFLGATGIKRCFALDSIGRPIDIDSPEVVKRATNSDDFRNADVTIVEYTFDNAVTVADGAAFNLFNSTDGLFSNPANLVLERDPWAAYTVIDNDYLRPDEYQHTESPYLSIETEIYFNLPISLSGTQVNDVQFEIRRRTAASPTVPVAIPNRSFTRLVNGNVNFLSVARIPTRSAGATDNYYVYGYGLYLVNSSGSTITIPAGSVAHLEVKNLYHKAVRFNKLSV